MAVTATQKNAGIGGQLATGRYITSSTAAAITITLGFRPRRVEVLNMTSGDKEVWIEGMADASAYKTVAAGTNSIITSNGITPSDSGFVIGLDTDVNVINEQLSWVAMA